MGRSVGELVDGWTWEMVGGWVRARDWVFGVCGGWVSGCGACVVGVGDGGWECGVGL